MDSLVKPYSIINFICKKSGKKFGNVKYFSYIYYVNKA